MEIIWDCRPMVGLAAHNRCISVQIWAVPFLRYIQQSINVFASEARIEGLIPSPATILSRVGEMISRVINKKMYLVLKIRI